jgi:hypothetical protein
VADPTWAPTLAQVGSYIPARTAAVDTTSDTLLGTFTAATVPTGDQVTTLISDACAWMLLRTGEIITTPARRPRTWTRMATATAAVRTAGMVELSFPLRDGDLNTSAQLLALADTMLTQLVEANATAGAVDASEPALLPTGQFPDPVPWGDDLLI